MSSETIAANQTAVERTWQALYEGDVDAFDDISAPDMRLSDPIVQVEGLDAAKEYTQAVLAAFPDFEADVQHLVVDGDTVITHWIARATFTGEFQGIPPTGHTLEAPAATVSKLQDGKIVEQQHIWDSLTFFEQLGVDPADVRPPS